MQLSTIIVSFNTKDLLKKTIDSIPKKADWEIIVVDNASRDGSPEMVSSEYPSVRLIKNKENVGFAKANNQGIKKCSGTYILLLNSDTVVKAKALENLVKFMDENTDVGIASGQLLNPDGTIQPQGGYLPRLTNITFWMLFIDDIPLVGKYLWPYHINDRAFYTKTRKIGWVAGTAMMVRRKVVEAIGDLDEEIFMYAEDVEYCLRVKKAGWSISITPDAEIIHYGQQSSGGTPKSAWLGEFRGLKYIFKKHKPAWEYPLIRMLLKTGAILRMFVFGILFGRSAAYEAYAEAFSVA